MIKRGLGMLQSIRIFLATGSLIIGSSILLLVGYYMGYCTASKQLMEHLRSEALSDKIAASVYLYYGDASIQSPDGNSLASEAQASQALVPETATTEVVSGQPKRDEENPDSGGCLREFDSSIDHDSSDAHKGSGAGIAAFAEGAEGDADGEGLYEAHLIGFGSQKAAIRYSSILTKRGIRHRLQERIHRTNKRRQKDMVWYQVVSEPAPYHEVVRLVESLKKIDNLSGVVLVEVKGRQE